MATMRAKLARLFRGKKKTKEENLRSDRTESTRKATGDTDVSHMMTESVRPKPKEKPVAKQPERKAPEATPENITAATDLAAFLRRKREEEQKKAAQKK